MSIVPLDVLMTMDIDEWERQNPCSCEARCECPDN